MGGFTLREMIINGWPVLSVLVVCSIISVTIICDRLISLRNARMNARGFVAAVNKIIDQYGPARALEYCDEFRKPVARVAAEIILQPGGREAKQRAFEHAIQGEINKLESYVPSLGTIGSTAPFIGLLGTVWGIIRAFKDIAANVGGGPEVVSAGIAEALITTAFGLLVAIPAVIFYNYFVHQVQRLTQEINLAAYDLIEKLTPSGE